MRAIEQQIDEALGQFWDEHALPIGPGGAEMVDELVAPVESFIAVEVLVTLDKIVGKKIPTSVIQAGGYGSKQELVDKLSTAVMKFMAGAEK